ncbi:MAG TPA: methyltransferase domain-containing protein [Caulobacteraceae bacterium]|nr:methyltransferase domain-containing protein [Caulobacteraceae bacterium]
MRRDVVELRRFYAGPLGRAARDMLGRKLSETWGDVAGLDVLGLGYPAPMLERFTKARRAVAVMPAEQGVEAWPQMGPGNRTCLAREGALPFPNALFDRVLVVHGLEESDDPLALLREVWRVMAPTGRVVLAAAARSGVWCHSEDTPFGYGRPFTRAQLEQLAREAELEPIAWSRALYAPPIASFARHAEAFEQAGARLWPRFAGLILLEAVKQTFAVKPKGLGAPARVFAPGALRPARTSLSIEAEKPR